MFRIAAKNLSSRASSSTALVTLTAKPSPISCTRHSPLPTPSSFRSFNTGLELDQSLAVPDVIRMCNYALRQARSEKSVGSYGMGYLVLKHCLTTELTEGEDAQHVNSKGLALLSMATLLSERGDYGDAIENLECVKELTNSYLGIRVAALEGQVGLHLELGQDDKASAAADECVELVEKEKTEDSEALLVRAKALKGLIELVNGDVKSAEAFFDKSLRVCDGTAALSYGEFLQAKQNYSMAKEVYRNVIEGATEIKIQLKEATETKNSRNAYLGAGNMDLEGLMVGAMCALGQLESHLGNHYNAEQSLTKALTKAEEIYGERHPKVAVVLTCMALMYRRKAIDHQRSSVVIQEGLYRRVIEILKVPTAETESEGAAPKVVRSDIAALARGAYAELLSAFEDRKSEGEKMHNLAESLWKNRRMSLADVLGNTEANISYVVDARISRLL